MHFAMDYLVRKSTLEDANICRLQEFFASESKDWEKMLYMRTAIIFIGISLIDGCG